ncbi:helix-turn-helix transcriptional regulator [Streptomyces griseoruber]|uniref:LuxR family transcriptional regulator n=1 Tax=Streptomyces griseoruber TaxID=1943 RepID=A0A101STV9_9ACTN|nr:response regulator transcription factor [Streptomyces griseoruber]KUN80109.1 LuxR family transcriptional regulator [Streptomyces griseoruber]
MRSSERLSVALACAEGDWPCDDWPAPDDPYVGRVVRLSRPFRFPEDVDVVVLRCEDPSAVLRDLRELGRRGIPVIVISPRRDTDAVVEVFRIGAGYLVEGDYCPRMLSSAAVAAALGHTYLSPSAGAALREGARWISMGGDAVERLRGLLSPRERQVMELLSTGLGAQEIGLRLRLSEKTVRNNLSNIYAKLDARGSTDAVLRWLGATPVAPVLRT